MGFDRVLQDNEGNYWIAEFKGGTAKLKPGEMEQDWVEQKIAELRQSDKKWGGIWGDWADKLDAARKAGKLRGIATEVPWDRGGAGETTVVKTWIYH